MEAQSLGSHQHSWWFSFVFLYEKNWLEAISKKSRVHPALQSKSTLFILLLSLCAYRFLLSSANIYVLY